jgi:hypothetical protein
MLYRSGPDRQQLAMLLLYVVVAGELVAAGLWLNPTLSATVVGEPEWAAIARSGGGRVYTAEKLIRIAGRPPDVDRLDVSLPELPPGVSHAACDAFVLSQTAPVALAWDLREAVSIDATLLAPREYWEALIAFQAARPEDRARFLARAGVRYYLLTHEPAISARRVYADSALPPLALYDAGTFAPRAALVPGYAVEPDLARRCQALFRTDVDPEAVALLANEPPAAAGAPGNAVGASAEIVDDQPTDVRVRTTAPEGGGFLVLRDMYDPHWRVEIDGAPAQLLQVDGIFRGVRVASGEHVVRFTYAPRPLSVGLGVSALTALGLLAYLVLGRRRASRAGAAAVL